MKKLGIAILLLIAGGASLIIIIFLVIPFPGDVIKTEEFTTGTINVLDIGDSKDNILLENPSVSFSPNPKPIECPQNWVSPDEMTSIQKKCLMNSDIWQAGVGHVESCPAKTDHHLMLHFSDRILVKILVRCTSAL